MALVVLLGKDPIFVDEGIDVIQLQGHFDENAKVDVIRGSLRKDAKFSNEMLHIDLTHGVAKMAMRRMREEPKEEK